MSGIGKCTKRVNRFGLFSVLAIFVLTVGFGETVLLAQQKPLHAPQQGRYQIWQGNVRQDTFLLDTWTGKSWQLTQFGDLEDKPTVWMPMDRFDNPKDFLAWMRYQKRIKKEGGEGK